MPPKKKQTARKRNYLGKGKILPRATVEDLPNEILTIIFKQVHSFSAVAVENTPERRASPGSVFRLPENRGNELLQDTHCWDGGWMEPQVIPDDEVVSISVPLQPLVFVCRQWLDIIHTLPEYWSRFVIFLDKEKPISTSEIQAQIKKCTSDIPLDVLVTRRTFPERSNDAEMKREKSRARAVMKILAPLISRCRSFVFHVLHSSSLPYISRDFRGYAPNLYVFKLECRIVDGNSVPTNVPDIDKGNEFKCPYLTTLALDGYTFMDACRIDSWTAQLKGLSLDTLSISNFTAPGADEDDDDDEGAFGLFDIDVLAEHLCRIGYIRHLTLANINVFAEAGNFDGGEYEIPMDHLTVIKQNITVMEEFHLVTFGRSLCNLHLVETPITYYSLPIVHHLRLEKTPDILDYQFYRALTRFFGHRLDIIDCPEFTDEHLVHIANHCEPLRRLYIKNCPNITVEGVKKMITIRDDLVSKQDDVDESDESDEESDEEENSSDTETLFECDIDADGLVASGYDGPERPPRGFSYCPIHRLHITGYSKKLFKADRKWFEKRVKSFHWV